MTRPPPMLGFTRSACDSLLKFVIHPQSLTHTGVKYFVMCDSMDLPPDPVSKPAACDTSKYDQNSSANVSMLKSGGFSVPHLTANSSSVYRFELGLVSSSCDRLVDHHV